MVPGQPSGSGLPSEVSMDQTKTSFCLQPLRPSSQRLLLLAFLENEPHEKAGETVGQLNTAACYICEDLVVKGGAFVAVSALDEVLDSGEQAVPGIVRG